MLVASLCAGCAHDRAAGVRQGPDAPVMLRVEPGTFDGQPAWRVRTANYDIHTTIEDEEFRGSLAQLMEGALEQYRRFTPDLPLSDRPLVCHVFANRQQWATFTRSSSGPDADTYLRINRGGYAVGDWYVAYFVGDHGTWSIAAHEGFHQYVARHFRRRPPPFLEEGLACMFEDVRWQGDLPRWDLSYNQGRMNGLRKTVDRRGLMPLSRLCSMHAGQVVNTASQNIEGFYAQNWAFAKFLWDFDGARYRRTLQRMLVDLAAGKLIGPDDRGSGMAGSWDPDFAKPLLESYLGKDLEELDKEYQAYMRQLVREDRPANDPS